MEVRVYIEVQHDTIEEEDAPYFESPLHIPGVMVYGAICSTGKLGLFMVNGSFNSTVYCDIMEIYLD